MTVNWKALVAERGDLEALLEPSSQGKNEYSTERCVCWVHL